jgi:hypothetical protein
MHEVLPNDETPETVIQTSGMKIHDETHTNPAHAMVGRDLRFMRGDNGGGRLDLTG